MVCWWLNLWFVKTRLLKLAGFSFYDSENWVHSKKSFFCHIDTKSLSFTKSIVLNNIAQCVSVFSLPKWFSLHHSQKFGSKCQKAVLCFSYLGNFLVSSFIFVLLSWYKRTKRSRLNINFTNLYTSVKARKTRLDKVEQHPYSTWSWCFATHLPARFTFGNSCCEIYLRPDPKPYKLFSWAKPLFCSDVIRENFVRRDWPQKNMLAVLDGGMCVGYVCSNTPATTNAWICNTLSCLVLREDTSGIETQHIFRKPWIFVTFCSSKK